MNAPDSAPPSVREASPLWPSFWSDAPEEDRAPIRDVLAELLGRGVILGSEGSGRELFLLIRDHYQAHLADYLAPLGLKLIVDEEMPLLQAQPRTGACQLLSTFSREETLVILTLWRLRDDEEVSGSAAALIITVDHRWNRLRIVLGRIEPPEKSQIESILAKLRRHLLVRTHKPESITPAGEMQIEILASLSRVISFDDLEAWLQRVDLCQPAPGEPALPAGV